MFVYVVSHFRQDRETGTTSPGRDHLVRAATRDEAIDKVETHVEDQDHTINAVVFACRAATWGERDALGRGNDGPVEFVG